MEATIHLGCIKDNIASWSKKMILPLFLELVWHHLEHCVHFWAPQYKKDKVLKKKQRKAAKLVRGLEGKFYEERLRTFGLFILEKRRQRTDLSALYNFLRRKVEREMLDSAPL